MALVLDMSILPTPISDGKVEALCLSAALHDIPFLLRFLRPHLPRSAKVLHTLRACQTPFKDSLDLSIFVDSLEPSAITSVILVYTTRTPPSAEITLPAPLPPASCVEGRNVCFFTLSEPVALSMLKRVVCFDAQFDFAGIERCYRPLLAQIGRWVEEQPHPHPIKLLVDYDPCYHFAYTTLAPPSAPSSPPDPSLTVRPLPADEVTASLISSHWPYASPSTPPHIQSLLSHFGGVGAYRHDRLIAWAVRQMYGALGMVHVVKEERGKGVGKAVIVEVVRRESERRQRERTGGAEETGEVVDDWTPFCYINEGNESSVRLFTSVGFTSLFPVDWQAWTPIIAPAQPHSDTGRQEG